MKGPMLLLAGLLIPIVAFAQTDANANLNVYLTNPDYAGCAAGVFAQIEASVCEDLVTAPISGPAFLWVVLSDGDAYPDGLGGCQFGVEHTVQMDGWNLCTGGSEIAEEGWPQTGTGNAVTWGGGCYDPTGENAVLGYFSLTTGDSGELTLTGDPRIGVAMWSNCVPTSQDMYSSLLGGGDLAIGFDPNCEEQEVPTLRSTWGQIKAKY